MILLENSFFIVSFHFIQADYYQLSSFIIFIFIFHSNNKQGAGQTATSPFTSPLNFKHKRKCLFKTCQCTSTKLWFLISIGKGSPCLLINRWNIFSILHLFIFPHTCHYGIIYYYFNFCIITIITSTLSCI